MMRTVSAREANQGFSKLLQSVAEGEEVLITRRGKPEPAWSRSRPPPILRGGRDRPDHRAPARGVDLGPPASWTRDELHER